MIGTHLREFCSRVSPPVRMFWPHFGNLSWCSETVPNSNLEGRTAVRSNWKRAREEAAHSNQGETVLQVSAFGGTKEEYDAGSLLWKRFC